MSDYQFRSLSATAWLCVLFATDNIYGMALATVNVVAYSAGAIISKYKEEK